MGLLLGILAAILVYCLSQYSLEKKKHKGEMEEVDSLQAGKDTMDTEENTKKQEDMEQQEQTKTKELLFGVLTRIGCQPDEMEDGRIRFDYQGITFLMEAVNECLFVNLIWPWCYSFSKFDIDEFSRVRQVVNEINAHGTASVFYSISDSDEVVIHIKKHFIMVPQIPDLEGYFKLMLDIFFRTARTLDIEIEKIRVQDNKQ